MNDKWMPERLCVVYDGPSRPMLSTGERGRDPLFTVGSISRPPEAYDEDAFCDEIARRWNAYPDMLDALRLAREYIVPEALGLSNSEYIAALDAIRAVEAAIAKATGEEARA